MDPDFRDISEVLEGWPHEPGKSSARRIVGEDGREKVQYRLDLGILQMETSGRPDGARPRGADSLLAWLRIADAERRRAGKPPLELSDEDWDEVDRELMQYYHRRMCWLELGEYRSAVRDADHNLALMDFVRDHSPDEDRVAAHERFRTYVLLHRTHAAAQLRLGRNDAEGAVDEIRAGIERMKDFLDGRFGGVPAAADDDDDGPGAADSDDADDDGDESGEGGEGAEPEGDVPAASAGDEIDSSADTRADDDDDGDEDEEEGDEEGADEAGGEEGGEEPDGPEPSRTRRGRTPDDPHLRTLLEIEKAVRARFGIRKTLKEQLADAVKRQDYERAARIRDRIRDREGEA